MTSPVFRRLRPALAALVLTLGLGTLSNPAISTPSAPTPTSPIPTTTPSDPKISQGSAVISLSDNPKAIVDEVWQLVNQEFVAQEFDRADWLAKRQDLLRRGYRNHTEAYRAIAKILKDLNDPYTRFLPPDEFAILTSQTSGEVSGVGIRVLLDKRSSDLVVADVVRGTPAMKAGIRPGDRIVRINGKPTALMGLEQATEAIKGEIGTELSLQLSRPQKGVFSVTLTRENIELDSVTYSIKEEGEVRVGYIRLDEFSSHAAEQMEAAINALNQAEITGFVMDLRGNPGGLLLSSIDIARMWLNRGEIVSTIDRKGGDRHFAANGSDITNLPLVILVNERSASASEILTGALKEHGRATVVGTETYGKGTVQSVHTLSDGSGLAVTIARYYPPNGEDIERKGISPDVYLDLSMEKKLQLRNDPSLMGTDADPQYQRAVGVLRHYYPSLGLPPAKSMGIRPLETSEL